MPSKPRASPQTRPRGFYDDWKVFCAEALSLYMLNHPSDKARATALLAGGAVLGAETMEDLLERNRKAVEKRGGVDNLAKLISGSALVGPLGVGAVLGALGATLLARRLAQRAPEDSVNELQAKLATIRREFASLGQLRQQGHLSDGPHKAAIEGLFNELTKP